MINCVELSKQVKKHLKKIPLYIVDKLLACVRLVEQIGVEEVRKIKGFHDEPLSKQKRTTFHSLKHCQERFPADPDATNSGPLGAKVMGPIDWAPSISPP